MVQLSPGMGVQFLRCALPQHFLEGAGFWIAVICFIYNLDRLCLKSTLHMIKIQIKINMNGHKNVFLPGGS